MKNKQHEYIFKAFLSSKIPAAVHEHAPNLIAVDSAIGGYCTQLLRHEKKFNCPTDSIISKDEHSSTTNNFHIVAGILICVCWNI